jgi:hypothetical protein
MTTPKPEITRKQAWCKLAMLIAEGLPEPERIQFFRPTQHWNGLDVVVTDTSALWRWAARLGVTLDEQPRWYLNVNSWYHEAAGMWHGYDLTVKTYDAATLGEPASDMKAVRALAEAA